jgi:lipopolysaccharide heptosyltransferase II
MTSRLLIVSPAWIGDIVVSQTLFKQCRALNSARAIDVIAPDWAAPLLEAMPEVSRIIPLQTKHGELDLYKRYRLAKQLQQTDYQQAIVVPRSWKSALIPYWAKIPKRTGWLGEYRWRLLNDIRHLDRHKYPSLRDRYMHLGVDIGQTSGSFEPALLVTEEQLCQTQKKFDLDLTSKRVALCPGAEYGPSKRWPAKYFATLVRLLVADGITPWLLGSPKDSAIGSEIQQLSDGLAVNLVGKTTLGDVIACLALADGVVSNDSGLMHIAAAVETPLVAIYGSTDPRYTPPLAKQAQILARQVWCRPCFKRVCPYGHTVCLEISPADVLQAIMRYVE